MKSKSLRASIPLTLMLMISLMTPSEASAYAVATSQGSSGSSRGSLPRELLYVVGALSSALSIFGIINSTEKEDRFKNRYLKKMRAMKRDFTRLNGEHFQWLMRNHLTLVKEGHQLRFRCELYLEMEELKSLLRKADNRSYLAISSLHQFFRNKERRARQDRDHSSLCMLYLRYQAHPKRFRKHLLEATRGEDFEWLVRHHLLKRVNEFTRCQFKSHRPVLKKHLDLLSNRPLAHLKTFHEQLDQIVRKRSTTCR